MKTTVVLPQNKVLCFDNVAIEIKNTGTLTLRERESDTTSAVFRQGEWVHVIKSKDMPSKKVISDFDEARKMIDERVIG